MPGEMSIHIQPSKAGVDTSNYSHFVPQLTFHTHCGYGWSKSIGGCVTALRCAN